LATRHRGIPLLTFHYFLHFALFHVPPFIPLTSSPPRILIDENISPAAFSVSLISMLENPPTDNICSGILLPFNCYIRMRESCSHRDGIKKYRMLDNRNLIRGNHIRNVGFCSYALDRNHNDYMRKCLLEDIADSLFCVKSVWILATESYGNI